MEYIMKNMLFDQIYACCLIIKKKSRQKTMILDTMNYITLQLKNKLAYSVLCASDKNE